MAVKLLFKKLLRKILFITICGGIWPMMTFSKVLKKRKHSLTIPRLIEQRPFIYRLCSEVEDFNILVLLWSIGVKWSVGVKSFHTYAPFHTYVSFGLKNPKKIFHRPGGESIPGLLGDRWVWLPLSHEALPISFGQNCNLYLQCVFWRPILMVATWKN